MPSEKLPYVYERIDPSDYSYDLPSGRIARLPASNRAMSNLLVADVATGQIDHRQFCDVPTLLEPGTLIVRNNTKVIPARLFLRRKSGARIEVLLLEPSEAGSVNAESVGLHNGVLATKWTAKVRRLKRLVDKEELEIVDTENRVIGHATLEGRSDGLGIIRIANDPSEVANLLSVAGQIPLPPYIEREATVADDVGYQTTYAVSPGAVAAPTAGLHFSEEVFRDLDADGIEVLDVTLHVGAGTFAPISTSRLEDHTMHRERFSVGHGAVLTIAAALREGRQVLHVGTTTLRTIESLYWIGVRLLQGERCDLGASVELSTNYPLAQIAGGGALPTSAEALGMIARQMERDGVETLVGGTALMIAPGYAVRTCDHLLTNFHQPGSTLLLLVAALVGDRFWRKIYDIALNGDYRFLSYGDASLLRNCRASFSD